VDPVTARKHPRFAAPGVRARVAGEGRNADGPLGDVSIGGVFVRTDQAFPVGTPVGIELVPSGWQNGLQLRGRVANCLDAFEAVAQGAAPGIGIEFEPLSTAAAEQIAQLLKDLGALSEATPVADQARLMTQVKGLLMELGESQRRLQMTEEELSQTRKKLDAAEGGASAKGAAPPPPAAALSFEEELGRARVELDIRARRIYELEREKLAAESRAEKLSREVAALTRTVDEQRRALAAPPIRPAPPAVARSIPPAPDDDRERTEVLPAAALDAVAANASPRPIPIDDAMWAIPDTQARVPTEIAELPVSPPEPAKTTPAPQANASAADPVNFLQRLQAGSRMRPTKRFSDTGLFAASSLIASSWARQGGTFDEILGRSAGMITEGRLSEVLFDFFRRGLMEFEE
jgi:hypothetical protein